MRTNTAGVADPRAMETAVARTQRPAVLTPRPTPSAR